MASWTKNADEELLVGKDWALDLDGATIIAVLAPIVSGGTITCEAAGGPGDSITRYWLKGGERHMVSRVLIAVETSEGERLSELVTVIVS